MRDQLYERRWELLALTSIGAFMAPLDGSIVAVALPVMSAEVHLSFGASIWVQVAYLLTMAVLLIPLGRLADRYGRVRFYLLGLAFFTLGSLCSALSFNGAALIGGRMVQGGGAALLAATSAALVTAVFPPRERGRALGYNVMAVHLGLSVGPPLGGFLVDTVGWRWIFLINLPIGVCCLLWGWRLLPRRERGRGAAAVRPDVAGTVLLATFLLCLLVPLTFAAEWGWASPRTLVLLVVAAAALVAFVVVEARAAGPLVDLDLLFGNRLFAAANAAALLNYLSIYALGLLTAIYLEVTQGRAAGMAGLLLMAQPLMQVVLSPFAGYLSDRFGSRLLTTAGMVLIACGLVVLAAFVGSPGVLHVVLGLAVTGLGLASFSAPNTSAVMGSVRDDQLSLASAFLGTMRSVGMTLSVAVLGGIAASQLGPVGGRLLFGRDGGAALAQVAQQYATGYRYAMLAGAAFAVVGAVVSLTRGARPEADPLRSTP